MDVKDIGVYPLQKGSASYVSSGLTSSLLEVLATNIWAGWTMGQIQDIYLKFESAGDQYVCHIVLVGAPVCFP